MVSTDPHSPTPNQDAPSEAGASTDGRFGVNRPDADMGGDYAAFKAALAARHAASGTGQSFSEFAWNFIRAQSQSAASVESSSLRNYLALQRELFPGKGRVLCRFEGYGDKFIGPSGGFKAEDLLINEGPANSAGAGVTDPAVTFCVQCEDGTVPIPDQSCDRVFLVGTVPEAQKFEAALKILKPEGRLCFDLERPAETFGGLVPGDVIEILRRYDLSLRGLASQRDSGVTRFEMERANLAAEALAADAKS